MLTTARGLADIASKSIASKKDLHETWSILGSHKATFICIMNAD